MVRNHWKKLVVAVFAAAVVAGGAIGVAAAQQTPTPSPGPAQQARQNFLNALAKRLNISVDQLNQAITGARQDAGLPAAPNGRGGFPGGPGGNGRPGGPGRFGGRAFFGQEAQAVAQMLGISVQQLRTELAGHSLAQVAQNHSHSAQDVINTITNTANARIDQAVSSGKLTSDQGNQAKQRIASSAPNLVNRTWPTPGQRPQPTGTPTTTS
ncbi:MAG: hypothetical protein JO023_09350 [Chloroflexi bacterium]|nr:hypothetical protein [Chloroflexota bacterium]